MKMKQHTYTNKGLSSPSVFKIARKNFISLLTAFISCTFILSFFPSTAQTDPQSVTISEPKSLSIVTSYPSPAGSYSWIKLEPQSPGYIQPICDASSSEIGSIYMDSNYDLLICGNDGSGAIRWYSSLDLWMKSRGDPRDLHLPHRLPAILPYPKTHLGIAESNPLATLQVGGAGTVLAQPSSGNLIA